ncbi:MAG: hypothetical protein CML95_04350 [Rhodobiaceae bacterium]|nr:hypothetical protein [Rhodobiaceae bacterium]
MKSRQWFSCLPARLIFNKSVILWMCCTMLVHAPSRWSVTCLKLIWQIFDMQLKETRREIKSIDLLPLINVVFLLILFVLIAGRPSTNHPSNLEVARSTIETAHQGAALSVWLKQDDTFYLSETKPVTLGELTMLVTEKDLAAQGLPLELIADRRAHARQLLAFRRAMARAGVGEIRLKTEVRAPSATNTQ